MDTIIANPVIKKFTQYALVLIIGFIMLLKLYFLSYFIVRSLQFNSAAVIYEDLTGLLYLFAFPAKDEVSSTISVIVAIIPLLVTSLCYGGINPDGSKFVEINKFGVALYIILFIGILISLVTVFAIRSPSREAQAILLTIFSAQQIPEVIATFKGMLASEVFYLAHLTGIKK